MIAVCSADLRAAFEELRREAACRERERYVASGALRPWPTEIDLSARVDPATYEARMEQLRFAAAGIGGLENVGSARPVSEAA